MAQQIINTGVADKGNGDPIRTAFTKVNANFTELFNHVSAGVVIGTTPPEAPGEGDLWWDPESGRMYVSYEANWVDASPVDGVGATNDLGKFIVNGGNTLATVNDLVPGVFGGYNINLDPGGESSAGISIPSVGNQQSGGTLQIFNNDSSGGKIMMTTYGGMTVSSARGTLGLGLDLEAPGTPDHFHVAFETSNSFIPTADLYFGDDYNYLQLVNTAQGVFIGTNNRTGGDQHQWRFQTNGETVFPGALRVLSGDNKTGIAFAPTINGSISGSLNINSSSHMVADASGGFVASASGMNRLTAYVADTTLIAGNDLYLKSNKSASECVWTFGNDGGLKFPKTGNFTPTTEIYTTSGGDQYVLESYYAEGRGSGTYLKLDADSGIVTIQSGGTSKQWQFGADGSLITPGTISAKATLALETIDLDTVYDQYLATVEILANEFLIADYTGQGYPASKDSYAALVRAKALNPLIPDAWLPMAMTLRNAYFTWAASSITLTVDGGGFVIANGGGVSWRFDEATGLRFPDNTYQTTAFVGSATRLLSPNTNYNLTANNYGVQTNSPVKWMEGTDERVILNYVSGDDRFVIATSPASNTKYWYFGDDGTLTLPSGAGFGLGETGQLKVNDGTTLSLDLRDSSGRGFYTNSDGFTLRSNGSNNWMFKSIGTLNLPNFGAVPGAGDGAVGDICRNGDDLYFKTSSGWATIGLTL